MRKKAEEDSDGEAIGAEEGGDVQQDKWPENGRMTSGNTRDDGGEGTPGGRCRATMTATGKGRGAGWLRVPVTLGRTRGAGLSNSCRPWER